MAHPSNALAARFRQRIEADLADLKGQQGATEADRTPPELDQQSVGRLTRMDAMQKRAMDDDSARRRTAHIFALEQALARIEAGEFGFCADCGEAIALARLEIDPAYTRCISCAGRG